MWQFPAQFIAFIHELKLRCRAILTDWIRLSFSTHFMFFNGSEPVDTCFALVGAHRYYAHVDCNRGLREAFRLLKLDRPLSYHGTATGCVGKNFSLLNLCPFLLCYGTNIDRRYVVGMYAKTYLFGVSWKVHYCSVPRTKDAVTSR